MDRMSHSRPQQRRGGLLSGLIGMVGTGVGAAAEYHEHRKERKVSRTPVTSPGEEASSSLASSSSRPSASAQSSSHEAQAGYPDDPPPVYTTSTAPECEHRVVASGVEARGDKKAAAYQDDYESDSDTISTLSIEDDEEAWELDEAAAATEPPDYETATNEDTSAEALVRNTMSDRKQSKPTAPLLLPVILPQRRPRNKSRGFVRAYSPVLEDVGIDQATFLKFLENFHKASQASPIFTAITVAAGIAGQIPEVTAIAVSITVQVIAGVGKEIDSRRNTNKFLNQINEELFKPAGCFAFIMKYKSDAEVAKSQNGLLGRLGVSSEAVDFSAAIAVNRYDVSGPGSADTSKLAAKMKNIRLVSGETRGSVKMPEAAPLIYPEIDNAIVTSGKNGEETFKDKMKDASGFLQDYMDRRAQIKYAQNDSESALVVPESERQMKSKYSDPNHPMFNGGLISLVSGGKLAEGRRRDGRRADKFDRDVSRHERRMDRQAWKAERRDGRWVRRGEEDNGRREWKHERKEAKHERKMERREGKFERRLDKRYGPSSGDGSPGEYGRPGGSRQGSDYFSRREAQLANRGGNGQKKGVVGAVLKVLQEDVLYLMIVPMPSEAELKEAREALEMAQRK